MWLTGVLAQAAVAAAPQQGIISYPATFYAGQQVANAAEMLARTPGFTLDVGASVRGFEGAAGNVLIDGQRPASKSDNLDEILRRIPVSQVGRIDIVRGGAPGIDMQGKSVVANVIRKSGGGFRGLFNVANTHLWDGRNMHGMRLELSGGDGRRTWEATARYGHGYDDGGQFGQQVRIAHDGAIIQRADYRSESDGVQQTLTTAYSQPLLGGRISLNGRAFWNNWKSEESARYTEPTNLGSFNSTAPSDEFQTEIGARFGRDVGTKTKLELVALRTDTDAHSFSLFEAPGTVSEFRNEQRLSETIGRVVLKRQYSPSISIEVGGEGAINELDSHSKVFENGVDIPFPAANIEVKETRGEVFAKGTWRASDQWSVDASLRYEASKIASDGDVVLDKTLNYLKPRLALSWAPWRETQVRLRLERAVGQLDFDDFVAGADFTNRTGVSAGNPNLDPETAWVGEAAVEQRFWTGGAFTLTYRHSELSDVIDRGPVRLQTIDPVTGEIKVEIFDQPTNIGSGTKDELIANLTLPFDHLGWRGALLRAEASKRWSSVTDPTTLAERGISGLRPLQWSVNFSQDLPQRGLSLGFDVFSGWSQTSYRFSHISEVKLHNAYLKTWIEKSLRPDLTLRMEVGNWTSRGVRIATHIYEGPRDAKPLLFTDDRDLKPGPVFFVRVRKTFGS